MKLTPKEQKARSMLCLPVDVQSMDEAKALVTGLSDYVGLFKANFLYTRFGGESVKLIQGEGADMFLDLKFYDIPKTMTGHAQAATSLGVYKFNVHASAGVIGMKAAMEGVERGMNDGAKRRPLVTAVTVLTSFTEREFVSTYRTGVPLDVRADFSNMSEEDFIEFRDKHGLKDVIANQVYHFAKAAETAGLDGIVSSAADLHAVRDHMRPDFIYATPGVKGVTTAAGPDQAEARVFTPGNAIAAGSKIPVVGRAITDPRTKEEKAAGKKVSLEMQQEAAYGILQDMAKQL